VVLYIQPSVKFTLSLGVEPFYTADLHSVPPDHSRLGTVLHPQRTQVEAQDIGGDARKTMAISERPTSLAG